eukprot:TRINITY_DN3586_c0_g1_i1.p1 TRINITY_DN3586_c0_g1~~TRINITY_DN3586_c0_g1_i1.p1  ORF type:complete len:602 (-),score=241.89 TRINITY_DN3586_c0_g1_i1:30-1835(-)
MVKAKKKTSKRVSLHHKYKVERKITAAKRKARREERAGGGGSKLKKDPGIPNLWPFKEQFIQRMQLEKAKEDEEKAKKKEEKKDRRKRKRDGIEGLADDAADRAEEFSEKEKKKVAEEEFSANLPSKLQFKDGSKKAYFKEFKKIVEQADVVLEVLDARDPLGCRCPDVEQKILAKDPNKKIILVLNKIDLIPKDNVEQWLKYLRNEYPTIAFKCSTQTQKRNLSQHGGSAINGPDHVLESSECLGAETLLQLLKNYTRSQNMKTSLSVGIIGYPNVGKSSLINSLKRTRAVGVGATPGFTKTVQAIHLDKNIKLLDCPGIVFGNTNNSDNDIILRNAVRIEQIPDPVEPVETIIKRAKPEQMMEIYKVAKFSTTTEFLLHIANKRGKLGKGGVADLKAAARSVLQDWNAGKIPFFTVPPKLKNVHISSAIVSSWGKEFDIDSILQQEQSDLSKIDNSGAHMEMEAGQVGDSKMMDDEPEDADNAERDDMEDVSEDEVDGEVDEESEEDIAPQVELSKHQAKAMAKAQQKEATTNKRQRLMEPEEEMVNPQKNKNAKKNAKKAKKAQKKELKTEAYDFGEYFGDEGEEERDSDDDLKLSDI